MVFVTAGSCRPQLESLTQLLVSAFQGSTIYQHADPFRLLHDVMNHKVDAVFLGLAEKDTTNNLAFVQMLHRQKPDIPVFIVSDTEDLCEEVSAVGANGYFVWPVGEQKLWDAMLSVKNQKLSRRA